MVFVYASLDILYIYKTKLTQKEKGPESPFSPSYEKTKPYAVCAFKRASVKFLSPLTLKRLGNVRSLPVNVTVVVESSPAFLPVWAAMADADKPLAAP